MTSHSADVLLWRTMCTPVVVQTRGTGGRHRHQCPVHDAAQEPDRSVLCVVACNGRGVRHLRTVSVGECVCACCVCAEVVVGCCGGGGVRVCVCVCVRVCVRVCVCVCVCVPTGPVPRGSYERGLGLRRRAARRQPICRAVAPEWPRSAPACHTALAGTPSTRRVRATGCGDQERGGGGRQWSGGVLNWPWSADRAAP